MQEEIQVKERVIQEYVPGKQITLAHLIAVITSYSIHYTKLYDALGI